MSKVVVFTNLTLDGVMQAPGRRDEDLRGGFQHGGWATPYAAMTSSEAGESIPNFGALLLGRRTYEDFYAYWPKQTDNPFTEVLNNMQKYVASTTLEEPLAWSNSTLLKGDVPEAVAGLKAQLGKDLVVMGSGELHPDTHEAQPRRPVRAPDPPASSGIGSPSLHWRRCIRCAPSRQRQSDTQRRGGRDLRAG
jgi:dihydrofolate reductase